MQKREVIAIMKKYGHAWEKQSVDLILECFAPNGVYQESPLSKPYKGHVQIKRFWEKIVVENTKNVRFTLVKCDISADHKTGFAEWKCENDYRKSTKEKWTRQRMAGMMVLKLKNKKISYLNEYWNTKIVQ